MTSSKEINSRIIAGKKLLNATIRNSEELKKAECEFKKWHNFNVSLLQTLFKNHIDIPQRYEDARSYDVRILFPGRPDSLEEKIETHRNKIACYLTELESAKEILPLYSVDYLQAKEPDSRTQTDTNNKNIFIIHGHDTGMREHVARFLEKLKLKPIILHEKTNNGHTLIEKFENHAANVTFAIALLSPDDAVVAQDERIKKNTAPKCCFRTRIFHR